MAMWRVRCPKCQGILCLPEGVRARSVRCGLCRAPFVLPELNPVPDDTIAGWLHDEDDADIRVASSDALNPPAEAPAAAPVAAPVAAAVEPRADGPRRHLRIVAMERRGVLLEFSSDRLKDAGFRASIPRVCIHCMGRVHLSAHVVIFSSHLRDSISLEAEHKAGQLTIPQDQLKDVEGPALLKLLPAVPNVIPPADRPMPYWVCDLCSGAGAISGQINVNSATGRGTCRMYIRNLKIAGGFLANAGEGDSPDSAKLQEYLQQAEEDRWDALPSVVRHRIEQWFRPGGSEKFLAYIPDRAFVRTEDGMAGLVISTQRVLYHRAPLHQEGTHDVPLHLQARITNGKEVLSFQWGYNKDRAMSVDRGSLTQLRRALSEARFKTLWT